MNQWALATIAVLLIAYGALSGRLQSTVVTQAMVFVAFGLWSATRPSISPTLMPPTSSFATWPAWPCYQFRQARLGALGAWGPAGVEWPTRSACSSDNGIHRSPTPGDDAYQARCCTDGSRVSALPAGPGC
jgi:hypothetical protein